MKTILELCEWCADVFSTALLIILFFIFLPLIISVAMVLFVFAVPVGIVSTILKIKSPPNPS